MSKTISGLERVISEKTIQSKIKGNIAYLAHSASIDSNFESGVPSLIKIFGKRLKKIFGPQHGFICDVQDNMVESKNSIHSYYKIPIISLYADNRAPTPGMLSDIDTVIIDLQDIGSRVYTYISTMTLMMEACGKLDIDIVILDRPNPIGGEQIEGNTLDPKFSSFVGRHPIPMRHSLTMGEMALFAQKFHGSDCSLSVINMYNWNRSFYFEETALPWVLPSPNIPTITSSITFPGTVLFEGTNISEGRGTTRSLEIIGHPKIDPYQLKEQLTPKLKEYEIEGINLMPINFLPTFNKHSGIGCGGFFIGITNRKTFNSWRLGVLLLSEFYNLLGDSFTWKNAPYEYEYKKLPIDIINGTSTVREWIEKNGDFKQLKKIEDDNIEQFMQKRSDILIY